MRVASNRGVGGLGDPSFEARRRWPVASSCGLPVGTWFMAGENADALEALLSADGARGASELAGDEGLQKILAGTWTGPADLVAQLEALALERDPPAPPAPMVDRADPLALVALGVVNGIEPHAVDLLADPAARDLLAWIEKRIPRALHHRLSTIRVSLELARQRAIEILVDLETVSIEAAEREALERPAREAAARVQAAAAAARARLLEEIGS